MKQTIYSLTDTKFPFLPVLPATSTTSNYTTPAIALTAPPPEKARNTASQNESLSLASLSQATVLMTLNEMEAALMRTFKPKIQEQLKASSKQSTAEILVMVNKQADDITEVKSSLATIAKTLTDEVSQLRLLLMALGNKIGINLSKTIPPPSKATTNDELSSGAL
jgi:hypothetical protein